jgi:glycosyltransferase involved in cell wall biosynthesis
MLKKKRIVSPIATESGAYVIHSLLEKYTQEYRVVGYNPNWTLLPFLLPLSASIRGADLIHTTPDYARFFYRKPVPLVLTFHNYVLDRWMRKYSSWMQWVHYATDLRLWTRLSLNKAQTVTAVSRFTAQLVRHDLKISQPVKVIYNGVDSNHFTPAPSSRSSLKEVRAFFSGNLTARKGACWLPSIAKQLNKNICIFYTQGLRTRNIFSSNTDLYSVGSVSFEDMPDCYRQMDILLMPTVREGFGLSVAEAMACGLPVVASNCSAIPELIDDGKGGFLCPVGDVNAFAEKINLLADSPQLRREMGAYNRSKVEKLFTLERMVKEYQELFEEVLS